MRRRRKIPVITKKVLTGIIVAGLAVCTVCFAAGYASFTSLFRKQYDASIRSIGEAARECLNPERFEYYITTGQRDGEYEGVFTILQDFVDKFDLNLLYVSSVKGENYTDITYIYNPVKKGGQWTPFEPGYFEVYNEPHYNSSAKRVFENAEIIVRHTFKTRSGSHITAMLPVFDSNQKVCAVIGVQKSIQEFVDARWTFINIVIAVEVLIAVLFGFLFTFYFNRTFIRPITLITRETDHFSSWGGEPSDILLTVKNQDELGTLAHTVHQMEHDVYKNMQELKAVTAEKERISTELSVAAKIQSDMLNKDYPPYPERKDFELFAAMTPAKEVGGDLYDYLLLDDDHLMLTVGDVSGKGVPAALFMGKCKVLLDFYSYLKLSPAEIFNRANAQLCKGNESELFVTCWLGIYTFSTRELKFVNAGHPSPVLYSNGEYTWLKSKPNFVLGGMEGLQYTEHSIRLEKGDKLFVYSDGVTEATDSSNELFGDERLMEAVKNTKDMSAPQTLDSIRSKIDAFAGEAEQFDDITMLSFELKQ